VTVRPARPEELALLPGIEDAADEAFAAAGLGPLPPSADSAEYATALAVLVVGEPVVVGDRHGFVPVPDDELTSGLQVLRQREQELGLDKLGRRVVMRKALGGRVLLWDFDRTLGYRTGAWSSAVLEALDAAQPGHGYQISEIKAVLVNVYPWHTPEIAHPQLSAPGAWWRNMTEILTNALTRLGLAPDQAASAAQLVAARYTDPAAWRLFDDTLPTLLALSRLGWRHVVVSNHVPELPAILDSLGLTPHLAAIVNSADTGYEKPHPEAFRLALASVGQPAEVWMIGDNPVADIAGARDAGINAILVRTPDPGLPHYAPDLTHIAEILAASEPGV